MSMIASDEPPPPPLSAKLAVNANDAKLAVVANDALAMLPRRKDAVDACVAKLAVVEINEVATDILDV